MEFNEALQCSIRKQTSFYFHKIFVVTLEKVLTLQEPHNLINLLGAKSQFLNRYSKILKKILKDIKDMKDINDIK